MSLAIALEQLVFARQYTQSLLADIEDRDWFRVPAGCRTHIAWQVGHLAMAEYGLTLFRQRGRKSEDQQLMSSTFRKQFSRGSTPDENPDNNPPLAEIRATLELVHRQALIELPTFTAEQLAEPAEPPTAGPPTKLGALLFCPLHEMIHAGQIGLLRRMLGKSPIR